MDIIQYIMIGWMVYGNRSIYIKYLKSIRDKTDLDNPISTSNQQLIDLGMPFCSDAMTRANSHLKWFLERISVIENHLAPWLSFLLKRVCSRKIKTKCLLVITILHDSETRDHTVTVYPHTRNVIASKNKNWFWATRPLRCKWQPTCHPGWKGRQSGQIYWTNPRRCVQVS